MPTKTQNIRKSNKVEKSQDQVILEVESVLKNRREAAKKAREEWIASLPQAKSAQVTKLVEGITDGKREPNRPQTVSITEKRGEKKVKMHFRIDDKTAAARKVDEAVKARKDYLASADGNKSCMAAVKDATLTSFVIRKKGDKGSASARWTL